MAAAPPGYNMPDQYQGDYKGQQPPPGDYVTTQPYTVGPPPAGYMAGPPQVGYAAGAPTTVVVVTGGGQGNYRAAPQNQREWTTGLCDCCADMKTCLCGYFCLPCLACSVASRLGENGCCVGCCLAPVTWMAMRTKLRTMYGINGSICNDYCAVECCATCAMCQMDRELNNVGL